MPDVRLEVAGFRKFLRPVASSLIAGFGDVAQLGEHCLCKAGVRGSSPLISTDSLIRNQGTRIRLRVPFFGLLGMFFNLRV